ncbi:MAG: O-antigen ligase family protein [Desulfamplus sp.]|nr:O-antigen ligase family protein [Desulfamplus sp.]
MPQFIIDLKTLYKDMDKPDRILLTLVALTFFSFPIGTAPPLILIITAFIVFIVSGKFLGIRKLWQEHPICPLVIDLTDKSEREIDWKSCVLRNLSDNWILPLLLFLSLPWIGLIYAPEISDVSMDYARKTHYWLYAFVIALLPLDKRAMAFVVKAFLAGLFVNSIFAFIQFAGFAPPPAPSSIQGYFGFGVIYSALSMYLVSAIMMASFFFKSAQTKEIKAFNLMLIFIFLFHISIMDGRNGYVTFFILSPLIAINVIGRFEWKKMVLICIVFLLAMSFSPVLKNRIKTTFINLRANQQVILEQPWTTKIIDIVPRFYLLRSALDIFVKHPVIGAGTGGYRYYTGQEGGIPQSHPHSNILYMGASFGIVGLFSYLWLCWVMFKKSWQHRDEIQGYFALSILLVIFISGFFNSQIIDSGPALFFALGYGLLNQMNSQQLT